VAESGDETMGETIVAYASVGFIQGELALWLAEEALMVGYEVCDFSTQFAGA